MKTGVILDTGPLVALLNRRDRYHTWAVAQWNQFSPPLITCEAVLSEACFLLRHRPNGVDAVMELLQRQAVAIAFRLEDHSEPVARLLKKYRSMPMSLADACLVRMSEQESKRVVFTLDSDFTLYRRNSRQVIPTVMPEL
jgi:predicted nucleic acid-binding protein